MSDVVFYNITISSTELLFNETINIDTNIGIFPNYVDQAIVFGGLSPFTEYTIVADGSIPWTTLAPLSVVQTTLQASKLINTNI